MTAGQLGGALHPVVPVSLALPASRLLAALAGYKGARSPFQRSRHRDELAALVAAFLERHWPCLLRAECGPTCRPGGGPTGPDDRPPDLPDGPVLLVPVPSSDPSRPSWGREHPLVGLLRLAAPRPLAVVPALRRDPAVALGHLRADPQAFTVTRGAMGAIGHAPVVVADDTYTSGATAQSAAAALSAAGARVAAVVAIGRMLRPDHNAASRSLEATQRAEPFDLARCAAPCRRGDGARSPGPGPAPGSVRGAAPAPATAAAAPPAAA